MQKALMHVHHTLSFIINEILQIRLFVNSDCSAFIRIIKQ